VSDVTPLAAIRQLGTISNDLRTATDELRVADRQAVDAREAYVLAYNQAFVRAEGSVEQRKALATIATHTERYAAEVADANVRDWRTRLRSMERAIEVGRSIVGVLRAEANL
jgi:hypothetical protein